MSGWDREDPGAGDVAGLDALASSLSAHAGTLTEVGGVVRGRAGDLSAAWSGQAATAWAARADLVAGRVAGLSEVFEPVVAALRAYAREVEQIGADARTAREVRDEALAGYAAARGAAVAAAFGDPVGSQVAVGRLRQATDRAVAAEQALSDLSERRRQADAALVGVLQGHTPGDWTAGGGRVAGLDPASLARGVDPGQVGMWAAGLPDTPEGDAALRWRLEGLPPEVLAGLLAAYPAVAQRLMRPDEGALSARYPALAAATSLSDPDERLAAVAAAFAGLSASERAALAQVFPWAVNNLDGAPLDVRAAANRTAIRAAIPDAQQRIRELDAQIADLEARSEHSPDRWKDELLQRQLERQALVDRIPWCEGLLAEPVGEVDYDGKTPPGWHQVVLFDPDAGRFGEVIGSLDADNLSVLVGGTGTNLGNMDDHADRAWLLVAPGEGDLAVITYLGGPMPQDVVTNAPWRHFADRIGPHLAGFANGVRAVTDVPLTVAGHSYGGLVVGTAEAHGLVADRVLYIEASGSGIRSVEDYAAPDTPRYSMTAPGDPIEGVQAIEVHGKDPDEVPGTTRLETGRAYDDHGRPVGLVQGSEAHSGVFETNTDSFTNIRAVMTGGRITLWTAPWDNWTTNDAGHYVNAGRVFPMADPDFDPPTQDVP